eukprot:GEMP01035393.1.p1 GENE.GEMP01035393.1~~GEMP01035393.1.p1  ORF type:complete len:310 (+),score=53.29 GEMP01035393.1:109-930(+)
MQHQYWQQAQSMQTMQTMQPVPQAQGQRYSGRVKSFSATNGYGFLTSPEVTAAFGQDIFVHQLEVDKITGVPKSPLPCGTNVSFTVVPNKRGQPQARDLQIQGGLGLVDGSMVAGVPGSNASMAAIQSAMMTPQSAGFQDYNGASQSYDPAAIPNYGTYSAASPSPIHTNPLDAYLSKSTSAAQAANFSHISNPAGYTTIASSFDYSQISAAEMAAADAAQESALEKFKNFAANEDEDPQNRLTSRRRSRSPRQAAQSNAYAYPLHDYDRNAY